MARSVKLEIELDGATGAVKGIRSVSGELVNLGDTAQKEGTRFGRIMEVALGNVAAMATGQIINALQQIPGAIIRVGSEMKSQLDDLNAIVGFSASELKDLGETAVEEAMRTGVAARDQVEAYKLLASNIDVAVIGGVQGLKTLGREVVTLSQAAKLDLATAAEVVASSINQFKIPATESARVVNVLAAGSKFGAAEVGDLGAAIAQAGTTAALANLSFEDTVGALEVLSQNALKGSEAGVGFRNVITILRTEADKLAKAGIKGVNLETEGLSKTLVKLHPLLSNASAMTNIFGRENLNAASILISNASAVEEMTRKVTGTNTAQEQAAIQTNNFSGAMARLRETINGLSIESFDSLSDELTDLINSTITAIMWMRTHGDEMLAAVKIVTLLGLALGTYLLTLKASALQLGIVAIWQRSASLAQAGYNVAVAAGARAQALFNAAVASNPIGLIVTVLSTAAAAFLLFRNRTETATEKLREQREEVRGLIGDLDQLSGAQAFQKGLEIKMDLDKTLRDQDEVIAKLKALRAISLEVDPGATLGEQTHQIQAQEKHNLRILDLERERWSLIERRGELEASLSRIQREGASNLEFQRAQLEAQVNALVAQGVETAELTRLKLDLAKVDKQIADLRNVPTSPNLSADEAKAIQERELKRRELEIRLMEEGAEKKRAQVELEIDREIEKYRQEYAKQFPELFEELKEKLLDEKEKLGKALEIAAQNSLPIPIHVEASIELSEADLEIPEILADGLVQLDGAIASINHNLQVLEQRFLAATTVTERWDILRKIYELQALQLEADRMRNTVEIMAAAGSEAFAAFGTAVGGALAGVKDSMAELADALQSIIGDVAIQIGKLLLAEAVALAIAGSYGKAARLAAAGTGLIILGSVTKAYVSKRQERREEREREADRAARSSKRLAGGGMVRGRGSSTSDSISALLSDGEFIVNADAAKRHLPILSAINSGAIPSRSSAAGGADLERLVEKVTDRVIRGLQGRVEFVQHGPDLKGTLEFHDRREKRFGGF